MKRQMAKSAMLAFPNFDLPFDLYTDTSDYQIRACLIQKKESEFPIGYFVRKLNSTQSKYTVTEKELLSIVEGLKYFRTIIYGHHPTTATITTIIDQIKIGPNIMKQKNIKTGKYASNITSASSNIPNSYDNITSAKITTRSQPPPINQNKLIHHLDKVLI